jgi:hypothetical protein
MISIFGTRIIRTSVTRWRRCWRIGCRSSSGGGGVDAELAADTANRIASAAVTELHATYGQSITILLLSYACRNIGHSKALIYGSREAGAQLYFGHSLTERW